MEFFMWLEATSFADWVRTSSVAYPTILTIHALGMGIMTGLSWFISLRVLGRFPMIPISYLRPLFAISWFGFGINFISGGALFTSQAASNYVHNVPYLTKMAFVLIGAISIAYLQTAVSRVGEPAGSAVVLPQSARIVAGFAIFFWLAAIVTGRLIAYLT
ncbi:MAG TPA: hypothetical protein VFV10_04420 [Gammaproteobacteria bacterium]|nr:hypothetical protein [Gammaproteobacteria bacterium]